MEWKSINYDNCTAALIWQQSRNMYYWSLLFYFKGNLSCKKWYAKGLGLPVKYI